MRCFIARKPDDIAYLPDCAQEDTSRLAADSRPFPDVRNTAPEQLLKRACLFLDSGRHSRRCDMRVARKYTASSHGVGFFVKQLSERMCHRYLGQHLGANLSMQCCAARQKQLQCGHIM